MWIRRGSVARITLIGVALLTSTAGVKGQQTGSSSPLSRFLVTGYGTVDYSATIEDDFGSDFAAGLNPIILFTLSPDIFFEGELAFELDGGTTETALEYAQIEYQGFEAVQLIAGKFLLPFGVFGERLHPTWINKLPGSPVLYGHGHGGVAENALLPILSDVGFMTRIARPMGDVWSLDLTMYVTQGPRAGQADEGEEHTESRVPAGGQAIPDPQRSAVPFEHAEDIPGIAFGTNFSDNNDNKMLGARLGLVRGGGFEAYVSGFRASYDDTGEHDITGADVSVELRKGAFEFRGEGAMLWQEFEADAASFTLKSPAYYLQASRRIGAFEPVVRWSHLLEGKVQGEVARDDRRQLAFGLGYWLHPSVPIKLAYDIEFDGSDRLILQWAYGF